MGDALMNKSLVTVAACCGCCLLASAGLPRPLLAGDWSQILGPHRNGVAEDEQLLNEWPARFEPRWAHAVGSGYAGPAVAGRRVVVFHGDGEVERVEALHAATGQVIWSRTFPASYRGGIDSDTGPRCVPLIDKNKVFLHGAAGDLHCVSLADGRLVWTREALGEFRGNEGFFGAGSTPIIADNKLLVNVGGQDGAGIVAFDPDTGKTAWKATDEKASYSSPTLATVNGKTHVIFVTRYNTVALDPSNGQVVFSVPFGQRGPTVNAATPVFADGRLFLSASYGVGAKMFDIAGSAAQERWSSQEVLSSQYATCVLHDGFLYGTHGREDVGRASLQCVDARNGQLKWSEDSLGTAHVIKVNDRLLVLTVEGELLQLRATPERFDPVARSRVSDLTTRSLPALSQGHLFLRENNSSNARLLCLTVGK
jgi:outer membrane protein assembly factor BamB